MFKRRGEAMVGLITLWQAGFIGGAAVLALAAAFLQPSHVIRKSVEKCMYFEGSEEVCVDKVADMTHLERIEYIRDTIEDPSYVWDSDAVANKPVFKQVLRAGGMEEVQVR